MFNILKDKHHSIFNESKIELIFSFNSESITSAFLKSFFNDLNDVLKIDFKNFQIHGSDFINKDSNLMYGNMQFKYFKTNEELLIGNPFHYCCPPYQIRLTLSNENYEKLINSEIVKKIFNMKNFNTLFAINEQYLSMQNTADYKMYKQYGVKIRNLKTIEVFTGIKEIDTCKNPGYAFVIKNSWIIAAWKMWFRNEFIDNLIKNNIIDFNKSFSKERDSDITFIQLYKFHNEAHFNKNIKIQHEFKKWINVEELKAKDREY